MTGNIIPILIIILLSLAGVAGDVFLKLSGSAGKSIDVKMFIIGAAIYCSTVFGWFYVMKHVKLSTIGVIYSVSTVMFLVLIGLLYFRERMSAYEVAGVLAAIISLVLLSRFT